MKRCILLLVGSVAFAGEPKKLVTAVNSIGLTVSDLDRSVEFYSNILDFQKVSETEVDGDSYERLTGIFGLRMRIADEIGEEGIELAKFLAPRGGRPYSAEEKANDLIHWQTRLLATSADFAAQALRDCRSAFVSTGAVELPDGKAGFRKAITVRDPDGHAIQIAEK